MDHVLLQAAFMSSLRQMLVKFAKHDEELNQQGRDVLGTCIMIRVANLREIGMKEHANEMLEAFGWARAL